MRHLRTWLVHLLVVLLTISCGGGGDSGGGATSAPPVHTLSKAAGDAQTGAAGRAVATAPAVVVTDAQGAPVSGVQVAFAVTAGGGSVEHPTAVTDAAGRASSGTWTLGAGRGANTVRATAQGLAPVTFESTATGVSPDVTVTVLTPSSGQTVGDAVTVAITIASTYQIATPPVATSHGQSVSLSFGSYSGPPNPSNPINAWSATLSLAGLARGSLDIVITVTDVFGNASDAVVPVTLDRAPTVAVAGPLDGAFATPSINVAASCTDDGPQGCASLTASVYGVQYLSGKDALSGAIDLTAWEGLRVPLEVTGTDAAGRQTTVTRVVFVESSPRLAVRASVSGLVWDASGTRVLFVDTSTTPPTLKITDTANGQTQTIEQAPELVGISCQSAQGGCGNRWGYGYLTPAGAIYVRGKLSDTTATTTWIYEWRNGVLTEIGALWGLRPDTLWYRWLRVAGTWAAFPVTDKDGVSRGLWRRDLLSGADTLVGPATSYPRWDFDVADNGDVAFVVRDTSPSNVSRYHAGVTSILTQDDPSMGIFNGRIEIDAVDTTYVKSVAGGATQRLVLHNGSSEAILMTSTNAAVNPLDVDTGFSAAGGFVAYAVADISNVLQIWRHGPTGEQQVSFFGMSSTIEAIRSDGTIVLRQNGKRYRAAPGGLPVEVGAVHGTVVVRDGKFLILMDGDVVEILP